MNSEITEAQKIELDRRCDVMYSLIPIAKHIIFMRSDIKDQLKEVNQKSRKLTMGGFFLFGANSGATWTRIPRQTGQRFQRKLDTDSTPNWTVK